MKFIADLHVHSKYSRATAKNLDLENLYIAAQLKGVTVVGTGDFTYPAWFSEISEKLEPAEAGLFKLREDYAKLCDQQVPASCRRRVRFVLATEISNIYKKKDKTRKNHNLVLVPDLATAAQFNAKLDKIGNIKSDGRPILGLDSRNLLEVLLETSESAFLIPAHIWTPWFSLLGSKSGFDSIEECFEDLTPHIFAVETGLSSDPPMNWRVSGLDAVSLVSNSDAHSPMNLAREANIFSTPLSYADIKSAIKSGDPDRFLGTFEFYPEEGKYHLDGHRNCRIRLWPRKTRTYNGQCPVCGKALTLGVLYRVEELADRPESEKPPQRQSYYNLIPLVDILSEILRVGPNSQKVKKHYQQAIQQLGSELEILHSLDPDVIQKAGIPLLAEAIRRMRHRQIDVLPGYDGQYGRVQIFKDQEREQWRGQKALFSLPVPLSSSSASPHPQTLLPSQPESPLPKPADKKETGVVNVVPGAADSIFEQLNSEQRRAVEYPGGPLLIVAGPGTGKTRTLTHRIAYLIKEKGVSAKHVLAVTFTNKAAQEMLTRLKALIGNDGEPPLVATFHALCFKILNDQKVKPTGIIDEEQRLEMVSEALKYVKAAGHDSPLKTNEIVRRIIAAKQQIIDPAEFTAMAGSDPTHRAVAGIYRVYQRLLAIQGVCDFEDLLFNVVRLLEKSKPQRLKYQALFQHIFVDEYQDVNPAQYRIIRALAPAAETVKDLCVIGDPDQSIYGFRGSDASCFKRFQTDYPGTGVILLTRNYRSTQTILNASFQMINAQRDPSSDMRTYSQIDGTKTIRVIETNNERAEAETIASLIEQQIGGTGFHSIDTGTVKDANLELSRSYADFAVFYRIHQQYRMIAEVFEKKGIPFQIASRENALGSQGVAALISFLKVMEEKGGFFDYDKVLRLEIPGLGQKALNQFKNWCFQNRFSLQQGLINAHRFPIPGMASNKQQQLNDFSNQIMGHRTRVKKLSVADKLRYIQANSRLSVLLNKDVHTRTAIDGFMEYARQSDADTTEFLATVALHTDTDAYAGQVEKVSLMTMHAAKGLEFPVVFIAGCEQDLIPYRRADGLQTDIQEERRLFYVALTRAMAQLYLTRAKKRLIYGQHHDQQLSPFVADIESQLKTVESHRLPKKKTDKARQVQLKLF